MSATTRRNALRLLAGKRAAPHAFVVPAPRADVVFAPNTAPRILAGALQVRGDLDGLAAAFFFARYAEP